MLVLEATATIAGKYIELHCKAVFIAFFFHEVVQINLAERFSGLVRHTAEHNAVMLDLTATGIRHCCLSQQSRRT